MPAALRPAKTSRHARHPRRLRLPRSDAGQRDRARAKAQLGPPHRDVPAHVDRCVRVRRGPAARDRWAIPRSDISTSAPAASSTRITRGSIVAIETGEFARNPALTGAVAAARAGGATLHVFGLLSPGGVHSHERQIAAMVELAAAGGAPRIHVHAFLDGRDTPPQSAAASLAMLEAVCARHPGARIASIVGRYYAMDRDQRWERLAEAYDLLVDGRAPLHGRNARRPGSRPPTPAARTTNSSAPRPSSRPARARRRSPTATRSSS